MLDPADFSIAITTAPRDAVYLTTTLRHVIQGRDAIGRCCTRVCASGPPEYALSLLASHPEAAGHGITFEPTRHDLWRLLESESSHPIHRRCATNTYQALVGAPAGELLLLQDDVELAVDWPAHLSPRVEFCRGAARDWFVLALYSTHPFDSTNPVVPYPQGYFFGNQALYFSERAKREYLAFLYQNSVASYRWPDDVCLRAYAEATNVPLFCCLPNLAQHVGEVSTGLGSFHSSPTYRSVIPPLHA
jgi:hypothetical protein